jgi:uroporphyrinogen-III synthase
LTEDRPTVGFFRPADEREKRAVEEARELGLEPVSDPLLETFPTGAVPRADADYVVLTSVTGVGIATEDGRDALKEAVVCAIGPKTADALEKEGVEVGVVPDEYTSSGLVDSLSRRVGGARVEVARSDHGSAELLDGLREAGAYVHETVLYEIRRPDGGGKKTARALRDGSLDAIAFTSSLTVEHLLEALNEEGIGTESLEQVEVYAIGEPTRETAESFGIEVDGVPDEETFEALLGTAAESV